MISFLPSLQIIKLSANHGNRSLPLQVSYKGSAENRRTKLCFPDEIKVEVAMSFIQTRIKPAAGK